MLATLLATVLLASASGPGPTPHAPGAPRFVQITAIEGLPGDSLSRLDFRSGMRSVFADSDLPLERDTGSDWQASGPSPNQFRLLEGSPAPDAWTAQIVLGLPPMLRQEVRDAKGRVIRSVPIPRRASRGVTVVLAVLSPEAAAEGARPIPERLAFVMPPEPGGDTRKGYAFRWEEVGRVVGRLLTGTLHDRAGLLAEGERVSIAPVMRSEPGR